MAKIIKTRIRLKYDKQSNWESKNPVLLAGEVAIATNADSNKNDDVNTSYVLMKVGNGEKNFNDLTWISALAADVYSWAKLSWEEFLTELGKSGFDLSGYKKTQTAVANKITGKAHVLTSLTQNENGEISYNVKTLTPSDIGAQAAGNYKTTQTAVSDPTASGKSLTFIDTISQDANGVISATKKNVNLDAYALKTDIPTIPSITITDDASVDVPTTDSVNVYRNLTANGHTLIEDLVSVPTKAYVDKVVAGSVDYLGTVSALSGLSTSAGKGDFYRVSTAFGSCHAGDLLVAEKDKPAQLIDGTNWSLIHGEEGDITEVVAGKGLTDGGSVGSITLNVGAGNGITVAADSVSVKAGNGITVDANGVHHEDTSSQGNITASSRTYITGVTLDNYGHVTSLTTGTETVVDTNTWRTIAVDGVELDDATEDVFSIKSSDSLTITKNESGEFIFSVPAPSATQNGYLPSSWYNDLNNFVTKWTVDANGNIKSQQTPDGFSITRQIIYGTTNISQYYTNENELVSGTYTYSLPLKTGTIALTNDIPDFNDWVLGNNSIYKAAGSYNNVEYGIHEIKHADVVNTLETIYTHTFPIADGTFIMSTSDGYLSDGDTLYFYCGTASEVMG